MFNGGSQGTIEEGLDHRQISNGESLPSTLCTKLTSSFAYQHRQSVVDEWIIPYDEMVQ